MFADVFITGLSLEVCKVCGFIQVQEVTQITSGKFTDKERLYFVWLFVVFALCLEIQTKLTN